MTIRICFPLFTLILWLASCAASTPSDGTTASTQDEPVASPSPSDSVSPEDGAAEPAAEQPSAGVPCEQEIALECEEGMTDGCLLQMEDGSSLTLVHICLPSGETANQPCVQEIARQCDEGLIDACLLSPAPATTHVCVQTP